MMANNLGFRGANARPIVRRSMATPEETGTPHLLPGSPILCSGSAPRSAHPGGFGRMPVSRMHGATGCGRVVEGPNAVRRQESYRGRDITMERGTTGRGWPLIERLRRRTDPHAGHPVTADHRR